MKPANYLTLANGKTLPFSFGMAALSAFLDAENMSLNDLGKFQEKLSLSGIVRLMHTGFKDGHRREKLPFDLSFEEIGDLIDENPELMNQCLEIFANSMPNAGEGNVAKPTTKKKVG